MKKLMRDETGTIRQRFLKAVQRITTDPKAVLERPLDVSFAIDQAIVWNRVSSELKGKINAKKIAVMGHSFGAYTTLVACGARPILDYLKPTVEPGKGLASDLSESRVTVGVALSPQGPGTSRFGKESYRTINRPLLCLSGTEDTQFGHDGRHQPAERRLEGFGLMPEVNKYMLWLKNADHLSFSDNPRAWVLPSKARPDAQRISKAMIVVFCNYYLKEDKVGKAYFNEEYANSLCGEVVTKVTWLEKGDDIAAHLAGSLTHNGLTRTYRLHVPPPRARERAAPLLIVLHGGGGTGERMERLTRTGFNALADRDGFIVVYPDGVERRWNDGRKAVTYRAQREEIDDVGFVSALIDKLAADFRVDTKRVYVTGISNGGLMAFRLALELPDKVVAIAPVTPSLPIEFEEAKPPQSIPVLMINGTKDPLVPWEGGDIGFSWKKLGKVLSTAKTVEFWVRHNGCRRELERTMLQDKAPDDATRVTVETYGGGNDGAEVVLYRVEGGGHTWPGGWQYLPERVIGKTSRDIDASEVIWEFFKRHGAKE
ncbi:MAG: PHB depolymerase family esterase [Candidatus Brocadiia bacterium]|nr:PHB depolymerase family esterase [Candidatus Brocadiia bacterium]